MVITICITSIIILSIIMVINLKNNSSDEFSFLDDEKKSFLERLKTDKMIGQVFCPMWILLFTFVLFSYIISQL